MTGAVQTRPAPHTFLFEIADGQITEVNHDRLPSRLTTEENVYIVAFDRWLALTYLPVRRRGAGR